jgi:hypothetical protein
MFMAAAPLPHAHRGREETGRGEEVLQNWERDGMQVTVYSLRMQPKKINLFFFPVSDIFVNFFQCYSN